MGRIVKALLVLAIAGGSALGLGACKTRPDASVTPTPTAMVYTACRAQVLPKVKQAKAAAGKELQLKVAKAKTGSFAVKPLRPGGFCIVASFNPMKNDNTVYCELVTAPDAPSGLFGQCHNNKTGKNTSVYSGKRYDDGKQHAYTISFHDAYCVVKVDAKQLLKLPYGE